MPDPKLQDFLVWPDYRLWSNEADEDDATRIDATSPEEAACVFLERKSCTYSDAPRDGDEDTLVVRCPDGKMLSINVKTTVTRSGSRVGADLPISFLPTSAR